MWAAPLARLVAFCSAQAALIAGFLLMASTAAGVVAAFQFTLDTDTRDVIARDLPWRQREIALDRTFPQLGGLMLVVVDAPTAALADRAAAALTDRLQGRPELFHSIQRPDALPFFERNGLLYLPPAELEALSQRLVEAQPLIGLLATDPSLRGLTRALGLALEGAASGAGDIGQLVPAFAAMDQSLASLDGDRPSPPDWGSLLGGSAAISSPRRLILTRPVLDLQALQPGAAASAAARSAAAELGLTPEQGYRVRLTGPVPLADEEFASLQEGTTTSTLMTVGGVLILLLLALRSFRLVLAVAITLFAGLATTAGLAVLAFGAFNVISVAFAVLFVGIAVDFGIQFCVRFGECRQRYPTQAALAETGAGIGGSLTLAAMATALGFLAFVPTDFTGVSELGAIAGGGMVVALLYNLALLPALITLLRPRPRIQEAGQPWAAPLDRFMIARRKPLRVLFIALALVTGAVCTQLRFDADPLSLKDPATESVQTLLELLADPAANPYTATILTTSPEAAGTLARRLEALPEVAGVMTMQSFVPEDQPRKLAILEDLRFLLGPALDDAQPRPPPDPQELRAAARELAAGLRAASSLPGDLAPGLAAKLERLAAGPDEQVRAGAGIVVGDLPTELARLRTAVEGPAEPLRVTDLPPELTADWMAPGGILRVVASPAGNARDPQALGRFADAVRAAAPEAAGDAVTAVEAGRTIGWAFVQALGLAAFAATILLLGVLRRWGDVALVLAPLGLAGLLTGAIWVLADRAMNFANVIALPLMLGIGIAFNIYFVVNWRLGHSGPLQSSLARAVVFSAFTTMTAFGSLALSPHLGTRSMGELLALALGCTLLTTLFVLPALLGPGRLPTTSTRNPPAAAPPPARQLA